MDYPIGNSSIFFCSISRGDRILYSHSVDLDPESLHAVQSPPPFHSRYSHTAGDRTFAFLIDDDGHSFFAVADSSGGSAAAFRFLELLRESFRLASKNGVLETLSRSGGDEKASGGSVLLQGSLSSRVWMRRVRVLVAVDLLLCLVLFAIWLAVCRGFRCVV